MPVITGAEAPTFELPEASFVGLAAPSRGATETSAWRVTLHAGGQAVPHSLTKEEIFVVISGDAQATLAGVPHRLTAGDALIVPPDTMFSLSSAGAEPCELLAVLPVGGQAKLPDGEPFTPPWAQ